MTNALALTAAIVDPVANLAVLPGIPGPPIRVR
jgi:hypothetical protein